MAEPSIPAPNIERLLRLFGAEAKKLHASLEAIRARLAQAGDKGTAAEEESRALLRRYLPLSLRVGHGEVIDSFNRRSKQTDVVIADDEHPLTVEQSTPSLFLVEGVLAAGEVKALLTGVELSGAIKNSRVFKELTMSRPASIAVSNQSDLKRYYEHSPWFLFAFESALSLETIYQRLVEESGFGPTTSTNLIDGVFVLNRGSVINYGDGEGSLKGFADYKPVTGWAAWPGADGEVLSAMLAWLSIVMPRAVRLGPILPVYLAPRVGP